MVLLWYLIIGSIIGWIAGEMMRDGDASIAGHVAVGIIGSVTGGVLFGLIGLSAMSALHIIGSLMTAIVGAILLLSITIIIRSNQTS